jgi:hypothetical protein
MTDTTTIVPSSRAVAITKHPDPMILRVGRAVVERTV